MLWLGQATVAGAHASGSAARNKNPATEHPVNALLDLRSKTTTLHDCRWEGQQLATTRGQVSAPAEAQ